MAFQSFFDFRMPTHVVHGAGSIARLANLLNADARPLIVADAGLVEAGIVSQVTAVLDDAGMKWTLFTDVVGNPVA
ncbi:MAG: iron-containing alcohol dehydrogenase, partial [Candidatus Latescibacterota bacterium]|nr:iron-containing alcohol dehydrogenase [Candidatus Latescibacterota bacterium]